MTTIFNSREFSESGGKLESYILPSNLEKIESHKNTRMIYVINSKLTREEIEKIIKECNIEFFSIDTTAFENVKEYFEMIDIIKELSDALKIRVGIIAELAGRKIKVQSINLPSSEIDSNGGYHLKKGQTIKIKYASINTHQHKKEANLNTHKFNENFITVNFKDIHKLVKRNESFIINDNKGSLKVLSIKEEEVSRPGSHLILHNKDKFHNENQHFSPEIKNDKIYSILSHVRKYSEVPSFEDDIDFNSSTKNDILKISHIGVARSYYPSRKNSVKSEKENFEDELKEVYKEYDAMHIGEDHDCEKDELKNELRDNLLKNTIRKYTITLSENLNLKNLNSHGGLSEYSSPQKSFLRDPLISESEQSNISPSPTKKFNRRPIAHQRTHSTIGGPNMNQFNFNNPIAEDIKLKRQKLLQNKQQKITLQYELICEVEYDCTINKNSYLFVPNVDYTNLNIDVLSKREVAEINTLDEKNIDFICISIKNMKDIESIREVNSNIKILASLPDYTSLSSLNEILENAAGIVLSRTFQILNEKTRDAVIGLTKSVIFKCRDHGLPVFSYVDLPENFSICKKKRRANYIEMMYNFLDGMDGFFINAKKSNLEPRKNFDNEEYFEKCEASSTPLNYVDATIKSFKFLQNYFKDLINDCYFVKSEMEKGKSCPSSHKCLNHSQGQMKNSIAIMNSLIEKYDSLMPNCVIAYLGEDIDDIRSISRLKLKSPLIIFDFTKPEMNNFMNQTDDSNLNENQNFSFEMCPKNNENSFLNYSLLFYSVVVLKIDTAENKIKQDEFENESFRPKVGVVE
jgi:pyruvate kinase